MHTVHRPDPTVRPAPSTRTRRRATLALAAGLTALAAPSLAQECTLAVHASPSILFSGQSADVNVYAHIPSNMYAFASAQFDVHAGRPLWTFASSGVVVGASVLGMNVWQDHSPQTGAPADPANPYHVWRGTFTPTTNAPEMVEITADPSAASVYPSKLSPSWAPALPKGSSDWLLVNPLRVGQWAAAPRRGTGAQVHDDVIVDGRIIIGENPATPIAIGLMRTTLNPVRGNDASSVGISFDGRPTTFSAAVQMDNSGLSKVGVGTLTFAASNTSHGEGYSIAATFGTGDDTAIAFEATRAGLLVAAGNINPEAPPLWVDRVPSGIGTRLTSSQRPIGRSAYEVKMENVLVSSYQTNGHAAESARVLLPSGQLVLADTVSFHRTRRLPANTLRQVGLGVHAFEATGARAMTLTPTQPH